MILAGIGKGNCLEIVVRDVELDGPEKAWVLALIVGIGFGVGLGWFTFPYLFPAFKNADLASWIQAIGVLGGIGIALWVPYSQRRDRLSEQARIESREKYDLMNALSILAGHAATAMASSTRKIEDDERPVRTERLEDIQETFRVLLVKGLPPASLPCVLSIQCELAYQISAIKLNNDNHNNLSTKAERARTRTFKVRQAEEQLRSMRDSLI